MAVSRWLASLVVDGVMGGAGTVLAFLPQIVVLTVVLELIEASGYLARGAFLVDRVLRFAGLGGRSFVPLLTAHACAVLDHLGVRDVFFRIYGLERLSYLPKPYVQAYHLVLDDLHARGADCILVEDRAVNLRAARQLGMRTVYVADGEPAAPDADAHIGSIHELEAALARLAAAA